MPNFGPLELFIILGIIVFLFGVGRISNLGDEMGRAVSNFRKGIASGRSEDEEVKGDSE